MQIGFAGLLTIVFICLKLVGTLTWDWIWILSPMWIGALIWLVVVLILVLFLGHK
jgi:uncharacterized protein (DUF983 family)